MAEPKIKSYKNATTGGWEYTYDLYDEKGDVDKRRVDKGWVPKGGLAIKNVYHNGYSFAKDIRVVSIWVFPKNTERFEPKQLVLGPPDFIQIPINEHSQPFSPNVQKPLTAPLNFSSFNTESALEVRWVSKEPIFSDKKGKSRHIVITQTYIFTDYNNEPRHEPSGVLTAARLFPITTVFYGNEEDGYIASVRVDYRLHLNLDGTLKYKANEVFSKLIKDNINLIKLKNYPNQAGVFKDKESSAYVNAITIDPVNNPSGKPFIDATNIFEAIEKPLLYEIYSNGVIKGSTLLDDQDKQEGWDNIHWWGYRGKAQPIISAPGATHAAHLHWRWGSSAQTFGKQFKTGNPNLNELIKMNAKGNFIGGPLVDPKVWIQTVRFAVSINKDPFILNDNNFKELSFENFEDLFIKNNIESIENGSDLIMFYSIEAYKEKKIQKNTEGPKYSITDEHKLLSGISGTYFIQGLFFGHEAEKKIAEAGSTKPEYVNPSKKGVKKIWYRVPKQK
ncbi:MAG: hypothetical protein H0U95_05095 [Bacteroidetes bacterium]|nr:hypothetical protein [Bacteroidota bacterium]